MPVECANGLPLPLAHLNPADRRIELAPESDVGPSGLVRLRCLAPGAFECKHPWNELEPTRMASR